MPNQSKVIAFDVDQASLISLRKALPDSVIGVVKGATAASLTRDWNPGTVDLVVVKARKEVAETLELCRFLVSCGVLAKDAPVVTDSQEETPKTLGLHRRRRHVGRRPHSPLLVVDTVREPLLILDTSLRVRSANRAFYQTFHVSSEEAENRLIYELGNGQWDIPDLRTLLEDVVPKSSVFNDFELEHTFPVIGRRVMLLNARKLQAGQHGELLVLAMEDVTERRRSEADLKAIETYAQNIVDTVREPLLILDCTLRVRSANRAFYQTFHVSSEETENRLIYELGNGQWDIPDLRTLLEDVVPKSSVFNDFELESLGVG